MENNVNETTETCHHQKERETARKAFPDDPASEDSEASSSKAKPATSAMGEGLEDDLDIEDPSDVVVSPAISTTLKAGQHRCKILQAHLHPVIHALVARPVGRKDIESNLDAQQSLDVEWKNLESKGARDYNTVREWLQVVKEAKGRGEKVHMNIRDLC